MAICESVYSCVIMAVGWVPSTAWTCYLSLFKRVYAYSPTAVYVFALLLVLATVCAYYKMRVLTRIVDLQVVEEPVGLYRGSFGRLYCRMSAHDQIFEAVPDTVIMPSSGELEKAHVEYKFRPLSKDGDESALAYSSPPRPALQLPPFMFEIGLMTGDGMLMILGMGFRAGDYLVTARHLFHSKSKAGYGAKACYLRRGRINVEVKLTDPVYPEGAPTFESVCWKDICAYRVPSGEWAALGARSLRSTELSSEGDGTIEVFGKPNAQLLVSSGQIVNDPVMEAERGVLSHTASTVGTYSGSPVVMMQAGAHKLVGMHISGGKDVNYAISAGGVRRMLNTIGFGPKAKVGLVWQALTPFNDESREERRKQMDVDYSFWDEERRAQDDAERELMAEIVDWHEATVHGHGHLERTGRRQQRTECWADMVDESPEELTEEEAESAERMYSRLSKMKRDNAKGVCGGWIDKSYVSAYCFYGKAKANKALTLLSRAGRIQLVAYKSKSWIIMEEQLDQLPLGYQEEQPPNGPQEQQQEQQEAEPAEGVRQQEVEAPFTESPGDEVTSAERVRSQASRLDPPSTRLVRTDTDARRIWQGLGQTEDHGRDVGFWHDDQSLSKPGGLIHNLGPPRVASKFEHPSRSFPFSDGCVNFEGRGKWWADRRSQCRKPIEAREVTPEISANMDDWMISSDYSKLHKLKGVGAQTLLQLPQVQEYKQIMAAGNKRFWKNNKKQRASNIAYNANGAAHAYRIGTCEAAKGRRRDMKCVSPEFADALKDLWIEGFEEPGSLAKKVSGYALPPSGPEAVKASFIGQCARQKPGNWDKLREDINFTTNVNRFCKEYPPCDPATRSSIQDSIDHYLDNMDPAKSAGWSARVRAGTKGVWSRTAHDRSVLAYCVMVRLALRIAEGENIHWLKAEDMIRLGLKDPTEIFTKTEAHDEKKVKDERWRLIWVISMIDSVCQDVMHRHQNKADIHAYASGQLNSQAVGLGHHDQGIKRIGEMLNDLSIKYPHAPCNTNFVGYDEFHTSDASGWDLSVSRDAIYFDAERRISRSTRACPVYNDLLWAEAACNSAHVIVIGTALWTFEWFGITASGIPSTSAQNSAIRSFTAKACGAKKQTAAGDDLVHTGLMNLELLASTGCITKEGSQKAAHPEGPVEFTSHLFTKVDGVWRATFNNVVKMLAHLDLRRVDGEAPSSDMVNGMRFALRHTPDADRVFCKACDNMGWCIGQPVELSWE